MFTRPKGLKKMSLGLVAVGLSLALLLTAAIPVCEAGPADKVVKVGLFTGFTGPLASTGIPLSYGLIDAIDYTNEQGGINGVKVEALWEDTKGLVPGNLSAYKRFKDAGVVEVMQISSGPIDVLGPMVARDKIPMVVVATHCRGAVTRPLSWTIGGGLDLGSYVATILKWIGEEWTEDRPPRVGFFTYDLATGWQFMEGVQ